eukprot:GHRR01003765.1.p1 GENE.GHRR01003765.1~~GHRR01003765.1.p1  ORF type:complete len:257 (+),score=115.07 GHRR01003765.1:1345-2115(+)
MKVKTVFGADWFQVMVPADVVIACRSPGPWGQPAAQQANTTDSAADNLNAQNGAAEVDSDDVWADRLWNDMQEHRRQAAAAKAAERGRVGPDVSSGSAATYRQAAADERAKRAAAAATESARILREEQQKDSDWRAAMMWQIQQAALPVRRAEYEARWKALDSWPGSKPITFQDIPWPCKPTPAKELQVSQNQLQTLVLNGVKGPNDVKVALRRELMRWHPDKFMARHGTRLAASDKQVVLAGVQAVAQQLTTMKQ